MPRARASAEEALEREPKLAEAHVVLAAVALYYDWDWIEAEKSLGRALELNPQLAASHSLHGNYLISLGRPDEALRAIQRAQTLEAGPWLDPLRSPLRRSASGSSGP